MDKAVLCGSSSVESEATCLRPDKLKFETKIKMMVVAFSSLARFFRIMFDHRFPACAFFFFFFEEIISRTLIPLFRPGSVHSGSASWDNCGWAFPNELRVSSLFMWSDENMYESWKHGLGVFIRYAGLPVSGHWQDREHKETPVS